MHVQLHAVTTIVLELLVIVGLDIGLGVEHIQIHTMKPYGGPLGPFQLHTANFEFLIFSLRISPLYISPFKISHFSLRISHFEISHFSLRISHFEISHFSLRISHFEISHFTFLPSNFTLFLFHIKPHFST